MLSSAFIEKSPLIKKHTNRLGKLIRRVIQENIELVTASFEPTLDHVLLRLNSDKAASALQVNILLSNKMRPVKSKVRR